MGSAASAISTSSANANESPTQSDEENVTDAPSIAQQQGSHARDLYSLKAAANPSEPGTSHSSRNVAAGERKSLAPSVKTEGNEGDKLHNSYRSQLSRSRSMQPSRNFSVEDIMDYPLDERIPIIGLPSPAPSISDEQKVLVRECLSFLEKGLVNSGVRLNADRVLPFVDVVTLREESLVDGENSLKSNGMYIVQDGMLDRCTADKSSVTQRLESGDFFGELSTLFRVPLNREVQTVSSVVTLLHLPADAVRECVNIREGSPGFNKEVMLNWCVKRSYLDSSEIFGSGVLSREVVLSCLKASVLSDLSLGAMKFIGELTTPMLFDTGDIIYDAGEEANYVFLVLKGSVQILRGENAVDSKTVKYSDEGICLGHPEFFSGLKLKYRARASSPLILASVSKEILLEMLNMFPQEIAALKALLNKYKTHK